VIALSYMYKNSYSKGFVVTLILLPAIVMVIIALVNGNLGLGVAIAGAFSLIRFRSAPGSGREIGTIFLAMAVGLALGVGYVGVAAALTVIVCAASVLLYSLPFASDGGAEKNLRISIPENLDYEGLFDDLFANYTTRHELTKVKTSGMGSVYDLSYTVVMRPHVSEKEFLDEIRCRNGNLTVGLGRVSTVKEEL